MKHFKSIKHFVVLAAGACILAVVGALLIYSYFSTTRTEQMVQARTSSLLKAGIDKRLTSLANAQAAKINGKLERALGVAKSLAHANELMGSPDGKEPALGITRRGMSALTKQAVVKNPFLLDAFIGWEPDAFGSDSAYVPPQQDGKGYNGGGRFRPWWYRTKNGDVKVLALGIQNGMESQKMLSSGVRKGEYYLCPRETHKICIIDPHIYNYGGKNKMVTSFNVPIMVDGVFKGVAGTDLSVNFIQSFLSQANNALYNGAGRMALVAPLGRLVAYTADASKLGKPASQVLGDASMTRLKQARQSDKAIRMTDHKAGMIEFYHPIRIGNTDTIWTLVLQLPVSAVMADLNAMHGDLTQQRTHDIVGMALISALVAGLGLAFIWWVGRGIARPLGELAGRMRDIATGDGDLTRRLPVSGRNELAAVATQFNSFVDKIERVMVDVRRSSENVKMASVEISAGSMDLSRRTENTAANLEESAAAMEELTSTVSNSAESSRHAASLADSAVTAAESGNGLMTDVVGTMRDISASSQEVVRIIDVIDSIAFQTNLLALNASVEAARAGEHGRGFAVVAEEVRRLANHSTESAKEIKTLIDTSAEKTASGEALVQQAGDKMKDIVEQVQRVNHLINEVTSAADEQKTGISQVNQAVTQLDQMTQENAALVEESAAASESLKREASQLAETVSSFKVRMSLDDAADAADTVTSAARGEARQDNAMADRGGEKFGEAAPQTGGL